VIKIRSLILCAGYATRLYPLTLNQPKPLLKVGGKPIIEYILDKINSISEVDEVYIVTNHKFKSHFDDWLSNYDAEKHIKIIDDNTLSNDDRLGAIGDIDFVIKKEKVADDMIIVAGDNLFDFGIDELIQIRKKKNASVLAVRDMKDPNKIAKKYGNIISDRDNKVIDFEEKPEFPKSSLAASATYLFTKEALVEISNCLRENPKLDAPGNFIKYLIKKQPVYTYTIEGEWYDIGSKEQLLEADKKFGGNGIYE